MDIVEKVQERKKKRAASFGPSEEQKRKQLAEREAERLWELIDTDFATLKRECKVSHPCKMQTLERLSVGLEQLKQAYLVAEGVEKEE